MTTDLIPTCDLCDRFKGDTSGDFRVLPPVFREFGGRAAFSGTAVTVKCFEDNTSVKALLEGPGEGRVLVVDGAAMYAPYGPFFAIIPEMLPRNVAGGAMALINSMGALGSFCGSWFVGYLNGATGSPSASYIFMGVALFASVWLTLIVKPANNQQHPVGARHA